MPPAHSPRWLANIESRAEKNHTAQFQFTMSATQLGSQAGKEDLLDSCSGGIGDKRWILLWAAGGSALEPKILVLTGPPRH